MRNYKEIDHYATSLFIEFRSITAKHLSGLSLVIKRDLIQIRILKKRANILFKIINLTIFCHWIYW